MNSRSQLLNQAQAPGDPIVRRRQALGLSRAELAHRVGVSVHTFAAWEQGRRRPSLAQRHQWVEAIERAEALNPAARKRARRRTFPVDPNRLEYLEASQRVKGGASRKGTGGTCN